MTIGRITYRAWRLTNGMSARLPDLGIIEADATDAEVRRVLAVLEHHRRGLELWTDCARATGRPATRATLAIYDEEALVEALIRDIERHRGEPARGLPGDGDWNDYNYRLQAAKVRP